MEHTKANENFHGIVIYKIKDDGCLNATWANTDGIGSVMNECTRKSGDDKFSILGGYTSTYIEHNGEVIQATLQISQSGNNYTFKWIRIDGSPLFEGIGLMAGKNHIAASYWKSL